MHYAIYARFVNPCHVTRPYQNHASRPYQNHAARPYHSCDPRWFLHPRDSCYCNHDNFGLGRDVLYPRHPLQFRGNGGGPQNLDSVLSSDSDPNGRIRDEQET